MRHEKEITAILKYCQEHFGKEELPFYILAGRFTDLEDKTQVEADIARKAIRKMAKVGIAVNACLDAESYFVAIDKISAVVWLMPPVSSKEMLSRCEECGNS